MAEDQYKRQVAYKASIGLINRSRFVQREGWEPSTIVAPNGKEMGRVNVFGLITQVNEEDNNKRSLVLTDHTGNLILRTFDNDQILAKVNIGDKVNVIGKPRQFNNQTYINAEIIRKVTDNDWLTLRKKELDILEKNIPEFQAAKPTPEPRIETKEEAVEEGNPSEKILELIINLDNGEGANMQEVITKSKMSNAEAIINTLLETGEIYEIKRGKIKVL